MDVPSDEAAAAVTAPSAAVAAVPGPAGGGGGGTRSGNKRGGASSSSSKHHSAPVDAAFVALLATAAQQLVQAGFPATAHILQTEGLRTSGDAGAASSNNSNNNSNNDPPVHVHWSKSDMASSLRTDQLNDGQRLSLHGAMRSGYRMARASHGVSSGTYYYECVLLPGPTATDLLHSLPANARLGPGLKEQLQAAVAWEQQQQQEQEQLQKGTTTTTATAATAPVGIIDANESSATATSLPPPKKKRKTTTTTTMTTNNNNNNTDNGTDLRLKPSSSIHHRDRPPQPGGHVRLGWSMRTADLQAPVGYDKWSYAIRSVNGALIHNSQRRDHWGGEPFGDYDVIGCCIQFAPATTTTTTTAAAAVTTAADNNNTLSSSSSNMIRFFKNGNCLGKFVIVKGKLDGGTAFTDLSPGTYYPAVSCYLGGAVRANFGPYWICPPKKSRLNLSIEPVSSQRGEPPVSADAAVEQLSTTIKLFHKKTEQQHILKRLIRDEAVRQRESYERFMTRHVAEIRKLRLARGAATNDLPPEPSVVTAVVVTATTTTSTSSGGHVPS
jgi:SPRY domain